MTSENLAKEFVGAWELVGYEFRESDGKVTNQEGMALLIYDESGYVSVQLMRPGRLNFKSGDPFQGTTEEIKSAFEGFFSYYGTYEVNEEKGTVVHRIKASLFPNMVGTDLERFFKLSGNRLSLSTPPVKERGTELTKVMIWERVK
jgi:hypothetical protein